MKRLRRTDPDSEEIQWRICCRDSEGCGNAYERMVTRWNRRDLGRHSNEDGCLFSLMKYTKPHRRSGRRGIYGRFRLC